MSLKKVSTSILFFFFLLSPIASTQAATFEDVSPSDWYYDFTEQLAANSIISSSTPYFYPDRAITRAELAKMAVNIASYQNIIAIPTATRASFCDVGTNHWAWNFVETLAQANAVQGQTDTCALGRKFLPDNPVTRAEALKILLSIYRISVGDRTTPFFDVDSNTWYAPFIAQAVQIQLIDGTARYFRPHDHLTRAEMSKMIIKLRDYVSQNPASVQATTSIPAPTTSAATIPAPTSSPTAPLAATFTSTCRPASCTSVDWHIRARALEIPGYQRSVASDGKLVLTSENFQLTLPDNNSGAEEYGRIMLYQLRLAYAGVHQILGVEPYALPTTIKQERILNYRTTGECCGTEAEGYPTIWSAGTREQYLQAIRLEGPSTGYLQSSAWDTVVGDHELTHRFNWTLNLSSFIDEGLAQYVQDRGQPQPMVCRQGGYEQSGQFFSYEYLYDRAGASSVYDSGDCFWQRIEQLYGQDMIRRIESRFRRKEERDALQTRMDERGTPWANWTSFSGQLLIDLEQAFVPEIGERFWTDFQDFCFSPTMAQGLTYESEITTRCLVPTSAP